jgi:hypothetical protein
MIKSGFVELYRNLTAGNGSAEYPVLPLLLHLLSKRYVFGHGDAFYITIRLFRAVAGASNVFL